jgi:hypothetical protein
MMSDLTACFARYGIWLLMSISGEDEGGDLADILTTGDGLNRSHGVALRHRKLFVFERSLFRRQ